MVKGELVDAERGMAPAHFLVLLHEMMVAQAPCHDEHCDSTDLFSVVTGRALVADGTSFFAFPQYAEGRIKEEKGRIHLLLWFEDRQRVQMFFTESDKRHHIDLCGLFGVDPSNVPRLGA
jgi:hypothetical protein